MMQTNKKFNENRTVFGQRAVCIGHKIYEIYGAEGLFYAMRVLSETILYNKSINQDYYFTDLRELECKWSGITDEFQC
jgi:hypothetical protein